MIQKGVNGSIELLLRARERSPRQSSDESAERFQPKGDDETAIGGIFRYKELCPERPHRAVGCANEVRAWCLMKEHLGTGPNPERVQLGVSNCASLSETRCGANARHREQGPCSG